VAKFQQLRKGSTTALILSILQNGPLHGYAIMRELEKRSEGFFQMTAALLYPSLHRMEKEGLIQSNWSSEGSVRRRKVYNITPEGVRRLAAEKADWRQFMRHLFRTLEISEPIHGELDGQ
jgi:PadR family transcriptional regulator PadR